MDIKEISGKVTNSFGGYGVFILLGAVALVFISQLGNSSDSETLQAPTGYSAYPDSVTNANVIIGEVNDHTTAEIKNLGDELTENVNNSTESVLEKIDTSTSSITDKIGTTTEEIKKNQTENNQSLINQIGANQQAYSRLETNNINLQNQLKKTQEQLRNAQLNLSNTQSQLKTSQSAEKKLLRQLDKIAKKTGYKGKLTVTSKIVGSINK